jgi:hypothetical protein
MNGFGNYGRFLFDDLQSAQLPPSQPSSLRQRFLEWYVGLTAFTRDRRFSMAEFEKALKTQGKWLSPILLDLGWRRKRIWSTTGQYHRYWGSRRHARINRRCRC